MQLYYRGKRCVPLQDHTWSSIVRLGSGRCSSTPQLTTSTIEAEGIPFVAQQLGQGLTWNSIARFGDGRCVCTLELATSTIKAKFVFLCGPRRGLTWSSIVRFCGGRCSSTLEPATSTIGAEGVFLCADTTRERSHLELYKQIWR